jgi:hypothetical protein
MSWIIWVVIAIVVIAILAAIVLAGGKKKKERDREHAGELRDQAAARAPELKKTEAHARETEAQAAAARAEADRKQAEADRLEAEATNRHQSAAEIRDEHQEHLRKADELDPDVNTKSEDYTGPDTAATVSARAAERDDHHDDGQGISRDTTQEQVDGDRDIRQDRDDHVVTDDQPTTTDHDHDHDQNGGSHRAV